MGFLLTNLMAALAPVFADGVRAVFSKITKGAGGQPQNVNERILLMQADTERVKALAEIDRPIGEPSQWVVDTRAIFRYAAIASIWLITAIALFTPSVKMEILLILLDLSGATMSFVIGERLYINLRK